MSEGYSILDYLMREVFKILVFDWLRNEASIEADWFCI